MHQYDAEGRGYEASPAADRHVVALAYVVDVHRDAGVGADPVLLHQRDEFALRQEVWRTSLSLSQLHLCTSMFTDDMP